jgi:hypothetical protein
MTYGLLKLPFDMCYVYDPKKGSIKRVATPIVKGKLEQTKQMRAYLEKLRKKYIGKDWDKEVKAKVKLKPAKV